MNNAATIPFMKMHGLGNDFVVIDERQAGPVVTRDLAVAMADRHRGIGFDQLVAVRDDPEGLELVFYNADGSTAGACGNASRCIAGWEMARRGVDALVLRTERGRLPARQAAPDLVEVNMSAPLLDWRDVPLASEMDTTSLPLEGAPIATGMGNPHCTYFVDDIDSVDLPTLGAATEHDPLFPERTNVQIAQLIAPDHLRVRVWERGVGITMASGSSSCAVAVGAARRGLTGREVTVDLDGGRLWITWTDAGVLMKGPWAYVYDGQWRTTT